VQKAIHALSAEGVIEAKRGTGLFIKPFDNKGGTGKRIGLVHPNQTGYLEGEKYPKPIVHAFETAMVAQGYTIIPVGLRNTDMLVMEESLLKLRLSGLLIFELDSDTLISTFREMRLPMVSVDYDAYRHGISSVSMDNVHGTFQATKHLIEQGHRHIVFVRPLMRNPINNGSLDWVEEERIKGYRVAMQEADLPIAVEEVGKGATAYRDALLELLGRRPAPTAMVASADGAAAQMAREAQALGFDIPDDISFIGFGNHEAEAVPGKVLSSVKIDYALMGSAAAELLLETMQGGNRPKRVIVPAKLALYDTVAPAARGTSNKRQREIVRAIGRDLKVKPAGPG
jgi:LacI family transcriptional regulator